MHCIGVHIGAAGHAAAVGSACVGGIVDKDVVGGFVGGFVGLLKEM